ncbi:MAG: M56 family metallopeptidase [Candidatus Sulfotelmatobacter sp.]
MFAVRGIAVALSVFAIVYGVLSLAVCLGWRSVWRKSQTRPARRFADLLFAWRMFPLATAVLVTAAFTVPSFLLLEPRAIDEPLGGIPLGLGVCGAGLGIFGVLNAGLALRRVSRIVARWTSAAQPVDSCAPVPVLRISPVVPAMDRPAMILPTMILPTMTAAGIVRPRVLLSAAAESALTANELRAALNHEVAHVRRRDNLKKLLLRLVVFPGMARLEAAWLEATEMAADDAAVSNAGEALDLAAALIKLSRLIPAEFGRVDPAILITALLHSPAAVVNARVERLIAWSDERLESPQRFSPWYGLGAATATVAVFAVTYSQLLVHVHTATEWLVR